MDRTNVAQDTATGQLACDLSAIYPAHRMRYRELRALLRAALIFTRDIAGGYALRFNDEYISPQELSEWITMERLCCPWLSIEIDPALQSAFEVRLTGPAEGKQVLSAEFAELLERTISQDEAL